MNGVNGHTNGASKPTTGFLSFNSHPPRVYITAEDDEFDEKTLQYWREEGYEVSYHPMRGGGKPYRDLIKSFSANLSKFSITGTPALTRQSNMF
jgi:hypothetical protein